MSTYAPPVDDIRFLLTRLIGSDRLAALPGYDAVSDDLVDAVLDETSKIASDVFAPLNHAGDKQGATFANGAVTMPAGFREAYQAFVDGGWNGLAVDADFGGQGLPAALGMAVQEMLQSANLSLALCTLLNQGAIDLLATHGSEDLRRVFLPKMVSGEWSGTMNLTEPQAGSDVGAVKSRAVREGDHYRITGQKIFISYGDHDMADNIIHLVLARLPDAPEGTKGLSLFLVPKILVNADGSLGAANDVRTVSIEHKLGQHASPTCVLAYGDKGGAIGYLVGAENGGINAMFTMMNNARIGVGVQGLALMQRATQQAIEFAKTRVQSRAIDKPKEPPIAIIHHADVRRMLMWMRAHTEAARALAFHCAYAVDVSRRAEDAAIRQAATARVDLLTPVVKGWITDLSNEVTSVGVQVHGGMGFIEETGAAQHMRDARVLAIYEGTNGIQANDLVFRKLARDKGAAMESLLHDIETLCADMQKSAAPNVARLGKNLAAATTLLRDATTWMISTAVADAQLAAASAATYLRLAGNVLGGYYLFRAAAVAADDLSQDSFAPAYLKGKLITATFYDQQVLPLSAGLAAIVKQGGNAILAETDSAYF